MYLASTSSKPAPPPSAGQRRDHVGASDSAGERAFKYHWIEPENGHDR
jgi:hypothetical protein